MHDYTTGIIWGVLSFYYLNLYQRTIHISYWSRDTLHCLLKKINYDHQTSNNKCKFVILVAAYKSSEIIPVTLQYLKSQDYPAENYQVIIITERSECAVGSEKTTGEVVDQILHTWQVPNFIHLTNERRNFKAGALNAGYEYVAEKTEGVDFIVVLDGDSLLPSHALQTIDDEVRQDGAKNHIWQLTSIPMANYETNNVFGRFIAVADSLGAVGKWSRNVRTRRKADLHAGSGVIIPVKLCQYLKEQYGQPWDTSVITEDARLIIGQYSLLGGFRMKTKAVPCALIEAVPTGSNSWHTYKSFWKQRVRWATGGYDEFIRLVTAKPGEIFVDSISYQPYSPSSLEIAGATWRRLIFTTSWVIDHAWWGIGIFSAPFLWLIGSFCAPPPLWISAVGLLTNLMVPAYLLWWCFPAFLEYGGTNSKKDFWKFYFLSFLMGTVYTLPVVFTQLVCVVGGRRFFRNWNPNTPKPSAQQVSHLHFNDKTDHRRK